MKKYFGLNIWIFMIWFLTCYINTFTLCEKPQKLIQCGHAYFYCVYAQNKFMELSDYVFNTFTICRDWIFICLKNSIGSFIRPSVLRITTFIFKFSNNSHAMIIMMNALFYQVCNPHNHTWIFIERSYLLVWVEEYSVIFNHLWWYYYLNHLLI